jgi:hypothetical protein
MGTFALLIRAILSLAALIFWCLIVSLRLLEVVLRVLAAVAL